MIELPEDKRLELLRAIQAGPSNKISAIKLVREATGAGLAEAKDFVERFGYEAYTNNPAQFAKPWPAPGTQKGCTSAVAACLVVIGSLAVWLLA